MSGAASSALVDTALEFDENFAKVFHKSVPDLFALKRDGFSYAQLYHFARRRVNKFSVLQVRRAPLLVRCARRTHCACLLFASRLPSHAPTRPPARLRLRFCACAIVHFVCAGCVVCCRAPVRRLRVSVPEQRRR